MHGDGHVGGLVGQRGVGHLGIDRRQLVGIVAARLRLLALLGIADHRPGGVVELQIAAAGVVEGADRLLPGGSDVGEEGIEVGIGLLADHLPALAEVERARRRDAHLRRDVAVRLQELEMLDLRMAGEIDLAVDLDGLALGVHAVELDRRRLDQIDALQAPEEIEMPPGAAELAVGGELEADLFLLLDDLLDRAVFDRLQRGIVDLALGVLLARLLQRRRAQQAADVIGAERRLGALGHCCFLPLVVLHPLPAYGERLTPSGSEAVE